MAYIGNPLLSVAFLYDTFNGDGTTTAFTMACAPATSSSVMVNVSGLTQDPSTYSVVGNTLTFSSAPPSGTGNISARYLGIPASGVTTTAYRTVTEFTATSGQTTFTPPSYTVGFIDVYRNGSQLGNADYTATNGTTIVLASGASSGDLVRVISFNVSSVLNAIPNTVGSVVQSNIANGVAGTGNCFSYYASGGQTFTTGVTTRVLFNTKEYDLNNNISSSVFTPSVAGYYYINAGIGGNAGSTEAVLSVRKNGTIYRLFTDTNSANFEMTGSTIVYANGSSDTFDIALYQSTGSNWTSSGGFTYATFFCGSMIRSA